MDMKNQSACNFLFGSDKNLRQKMFSAAKGNLLPMNA